MRSIVPAIAMVSSIAHPMFSLSRQVLGQEAWRAAPAEGSEGRARLPHAVLVLSFAESSSKPEIQVATYTVASGWPKNPAACPRARRSSIATATTELLDEERRP